MTKIVTAICSMLFAIPLWAQADGLSLEEAQKISAQTGRPILAVAGSKT